MSELSRHLSGLQIAGINKVGDTLLPGADEFPSFSQAGCVRHVDRILDYMPEQDLSDLKLLLLLLGLMPSFLVRALLGWIDHSPASTGPVGPLLRLIRLGLRGLVMTLYYGDDAILKKIGYAVQVRRGTSEISLPAP